ncbi:MAG: M3 family oligoendopeptidase [Clostridiales bacterium]|nr:M3 family oligoendopeptidase [Clostridiales bacterium]
MKVKDLPYKRFDINKAEAVIKENTEAVKNAKNVDEVLKAHDNVLNAVSEFSTMGSLAYTRYTLNTFDEFYLKEREYNDSIAPLLTELMNDFGKAMLNSPFIDELKKVLNPLVFEKYKILAASSDPRIIEDRQKEAEIVGEYSKLMAEMNFEFNGEEMPLSVLRGYLNEGDRNVRKAACEAMGKGLKKHAAQLDDIFDRLVHVRHNMAKKLGYDNFVELGYLNMERMDYNRDMVENFRKSVLTDLVPAITDMKKQLAAKLGIKDYMFYDDGVCFTDGEPKPVIDKDEIFRQAQIMYNEMSPEIGKFMKSMLDAEAFDVDARKGKWGGGYCTTFEDYKQVFILANFNGSSDDIDVITHEFGHAIAMDMALNTGDRELGIGGSETAECHSMSMEFLSWPYMDRFFGKDADKYRYKHLMFSLSFIPYGTIVDEFQHIVYSNPDMTPAQRNEAYLELERKYRPYLSYDGIPYLEEGTRWQYQMHIFETPFYYIDYCLAQTVALGFLVESRKDYNDALRRYLEFCRAGGQILFSQLCKRAGLVSPFEKGALKKIADEVPQLLKEL